MGGHLRDVVGQTVFSAGRENHLVQIEVAEHAHQNLAVHPVGESPVSRDDVGEVLHFDGPFEPRGEEPSERRDHRSEQRQDETVHLELGQGHLGQAEVLEVLGQGDVSDGREDRVRGAVYRLERFYHDLLLGTDEVLVILEELSSVYSKEQGGDGSPDEALPSLLRRYLDQLGPAEQFAPNVGKNIIGNDQETGEYEPNESFVHVDGDG